MVFEIRDNNSMQGDIFRAFEIRFILIEDGWRFEVLTPAYNPTFPELPDDGGMDFGGFYFGEVYTASEIAKMRSETQQQIRDLTLQLRMAEQELKQKEFELSNGEVTCEIAGVVKSVLSPDEALASNQPVVTVSGGGGYFITGCMSEFDLAYLHVGSVVSVENYSTGATLDAAITEISQFPVPDGEYTDYYYSNGNNNVSKYEFTVAVDEDANLRENSYAAITYVPSALASGQEEDDGAFYLENAFLRTENGRRYVYVMNGDGLLEKRFVITEGGDSWSTKVTGGLDFENDYVAFPYGRSVKDGVKAVQQESTDSLYNGY